MAAAVPRPSKPPMRVYARWREQVALSLPSSVHPVTVHQYNMPIKPSEPLHLGLRVKVMALSPTVYRTLIPCFAHPCYDVYDAQIEGEIVGVRVQRDAQVYFAIRNERETNRVSHVVVIAPYVLGETLAESSPRASCDWLDAMCATERPSDVRDLKVGLEKTAVVLDDVAVSPISFRYPDPPYLRDRLYMRL
ncbi:hypothetical protein L227DRAFT_614587 [Lentinus tigrinus ALCF2SS1-6]|uniref:Uncharacterized protein n=1 Tax=Lentinus tigrinus ALCF2SS1-6 TaxID=1328759 RepID=A0A5C2RZN8_9APHY|nr:hypothetical protein L227DRAFT_614587 [Lentinus tigrinus ALCF2SS1-6]